MLVTLPDKNMVIEFPDSMSTDDVEKSIYLEVYGQSVLSEQTKPQTFLDKAKTVKDNIISSVNKHIPNFLKDKETLQPPEKTTVQKPKELFTKVSTPSDADNSYPDEFSGVSNKSPVDLPIEYAPYLAVKALQGAMSPLLGPLKTLGMDTKGSLEVAAEYWQKQLPDVRIPNAGLVKTKEGWSIERIDDYPLSELLGATTEGVGFLVPATPALKAGGLVAEKVASSARPFFKHILKGMVGGALLGEGDKDKTLESMAMFGIFEGAGYSIGKAVEAIKNIKSSNLYRKATIKERGLVLQSLEETLQKNPKISEGELVKKSDAYFEEAIKRRSAEPTEQPVNIGEKPGRSLETEVKTDLTVEQKYANMVEEKFSQKEKGSLAFPTESHLDVARGLAKESVSKAVPLPDMVDPKVQPEKPSIPMPEPLVRKSTNRNEATDNILYSNIQSKAGVEVPAKQTFTPIPEGQRRTYIINQLSAKLSVPIKTGKFRQMASGIYKQKEQVIRVKQTNDFKTIIHEVGHHIEAALGFNGKMPTEIQRLAYPNAKSKSKEGFAEFLRYYITEPNVVKSKAPVFLETFESALEQSPDIKNVLVTARESWVTFQEATSVSKIHSFITSGTKQRKVPTMDEVYTEVKDNLYPIKRAVEFAKKQGADVTAMTDPYIKARLARGWTRKAEQFLRHQPFRYNSSGEAVFQGKALRDILVDVETSGERGLLDTYLVAKRAVSDIRVREGFKGILSDGDFAQTVKELEPRFKKIADDLNGYNNILLDYLVDSGRINEYLAQNIRSKNLFYTPLYRMMDIESSQLGQKAGSVFNPIKKLKGSSKDIISPTESILKNTYAIINSAERTRVGTDLLNLANVKGMGGLIEVVPFPQKVNRVTTIDALKNISKQLSNINSTVAQEVNGTIESLVGHQKNIKTLSDLAANRASEKTINDFMKNVGLEQKDIFVLDDFLKTFGVDKQRVGKNETILYKNGEPVLVELDPWLHKAIENVNPGELNLFIKLAAYPAKWLRAGATTFSPEFGIRNPIRDQLTAFIQSRYGFVPGVDFVKGLYNMAGHTRLWQEFNASGAAHSAVVSIDRSYISKNLKSLLSSDVATFSKNPLKWLQTISEYTEEASRVGEFIRARGKSATLPEAGMAGREVSLDFGKQGGSGARAANMISAFWNARIEGLDKMRRSFKSKPMATAFKAFVSVTLPSILLWWAQKDNPHYQELPPWRKILFWNIAIDGKDDKFDFFIPIPKPFEWGLLFGSVPEAALDWAYTKDKTMFTKTIGQALKSLDPTPIPTGAIPVVEWWANKSYFFDKPLAPRDKEVLEPYLQYSGRTSETMKLATKMVKDIPGLKEVANPSKLDNLLMGYTAGAGRLALESSDWVLKTLGVVKTPPDPKMTIGDIPGLRAFSVRFPSSSSFSIERFYKDYTNEMTRWESKKERAGLRGVGVIELNDLNPRLQRMKGVATTLSVLRKMVATTYESELSPEIKTKVLNELYYNMINQARLFYNKTPIKVQKIKEK